MKAIHNIGVNVSTTQNNIELSNIITAFGRDVRKLVEGKESESVIYPSINELKQIIEQVSTRPNPVLNAHSSASADKVTKENSNNQELGKIIRFRRMFMEMTNEEIHDALNENAEYYGMGPARLMTALVVSDISKLLK